MSSEWMKVMLEEIARKKAEAEAARIEEQTRIEEQARSEERAHNDGQAGAATAAQPRSGTDRARG